MEGESIRRPLMWNGSPSAAIYTYGAICTVGPASCRSAGIRPAGMPVLLSFAATGEVSTCVVSPGHRRDYATELAKHSNKLKR